jgi:hypothetical protein
VKTRALATPLSHAKHARTASLGQFFNGIGHERTSPLESIWSQSGLLIETDWAAGRFAMAKTRSLQVTCPL